jgi:hydratase-aldolase
MLTRETMKGLYVLTITPFDQKFRLDEDAYRENVRKLLALGVDGIITTGTNGEFHTLEDGELARIASLVVKEVKGKAVAVVGASGVNTAEAIQRTRVAQDAGADAVMNVIPYYLPVTKDEAFQYFRDVTSACKEVGFILYNNPYTTQVSFDDDDFVKLQEIPAFCGTKMTGGDIYLYLNSLRRTTLRHFPLEQLWGVSNAVGGNGVMASFIYAFPHFMMKWWSAISGGDFAAALKMQHEVNVILQDAVLPLIVSEGFSEVAATKAVVDAAGFFKAGPCRKPFRAVPQERIKKLRALFEEKFPQFLAKK